VRGYSDGNGVWSLVEDGGWGDRVDAKTEVVLNQP